MKVLVTGACGFLGSHVCEEFKGEGWDVIALDNMTKYELGRNPLVDGEKARKYMVYFLKGLAIPLTEGDIRDRDMVDWAVKDCSYIINCAAQPAMTIALENPIYDMEINLMGSVNLLETARTHNIPIALCSTIHVYGNGINEFLKEGKDRFELEYFPNSDIWEGKQDIAEDAPILSGKITPLHASKGSMEIYGRAYMESCGIDVAIFRLTGIYGPRQFGGEDHGWVANFTIRALLNKPIRIFGTDKQVRDILYVRDAAKAFKCFWKTRKSGMYNIGGGIKAATSLKECLNILKGIMGYPQDIHFKEARPMDLWYFVCNIEKAKRDLGWTPKVMPIEGIKELAAWVKANMELFNKEEM